LDKNKLLIKSDVRNGFFYVLSLNYSADCIELPHEDHPLRYTAHCHKSSPNLGERSHLAILCNRL